MAIPPDLKQTDLLNALESVQHRFSSLFEYTSDLVLIVSCRDEILSANPSFEKTTGVTMEQMYRGEAGWTDFIFGEDLPGISEAFSGVRTSGKQANAICRIRSGQEFYWHDMSIHPIPLDSGRSGLFCVARDVHRFKLAEQNLKLQTQILRDRQLESLRRMDRIKSLVSGLATVKGGRLEFLGGLRDGLSQLFPSFAVTVYCDCAGSDPEKFFQFPVLRALFMAGSSVCWSAPSPAPDGLDGMGEAFLGVPVLDVGAAPAGAIWLASDVPWEFSIADTDVLLHAGQILSSHISQWRSEDAHDQQLKKSLQGQKMEALGRLAGGLAHDFNNLISIIINYSQFAAKNLKPDSKAFADVSVVQDAARQAAEFTRKLMHYARAKPPEKHPLDLNVLVQKTVDLIRHGIRKDVSISLSLQNNLPMILADASQMNQVVMNLCLNAAQAIGARVGNIRICTRLRVNPSASDGSVVMEVKDDGPGIPPEILPKIFEDFVTSKGDGVGLGLSIVHQVVNGHGGEVQVESEPGGGALFRCIFPMYVPDSLGPTV